MVPPCSFKRYAQADLSEIYDKVLSQRITFVALLKTKKTSESSEVFCLIELSTF